MVLHRPGERDHVPAIVAHHALRDAGRARGVEDVERIGREHRHAGRGLVRRDRVVAQRRPVVVAAGDERRLRLAAAAGSGRLRACAWRARSPHRAAACTRRRARPRCRRRRTGSASAWQSSMRVASSFGREAAEHDRMDRADARAGEHREQRLGHHRHVEDDAVALGDAESCSMAASVATSRSSSA